MHRETFTKKSVERIQACRAKISYIEKVTFAKTRRASSTGISMDRQRTVLRRKVLTFLRLNADVDENLRTCRLIQ